MDVQRDNLHLKVNDVLELQRLEIHHAEAFFNLTNENRAFLRPWLPWVDEAQSVWEVRRLIGNGNDPENQTNRVHAGIWLHGELAGAISLNYINYATRQTEIGYWLGQRFQGKGVMTTACRALLGYVFDHLQLERVEIRCDVRNIRSRLIPERLGFKKENTTAQFDWKNGRYIDTIIYGMDAAQWAQVRFPKGDQQ